MLDNGRHPTATRPEMSIGPGSASVLRRYAKIRVSDRVLLMAINKQIATPIDRHCSLIYNKQLRIAASEEKLSEQNGGPDIVSLRHDMRKGRGSWKVYWQSQGQPWRIEREIDRRRQHELTRRRGIVPDIEKGIYPFKEMKLSRADIEWLLATHEGGLGPVEWSEESQRGRTGLDLRGADLQQVDLSGLPLACMQGGLSGHVWTYTMEGLDDMASVHMEKAVLRGAHLEGAKLRKAYMQEADLFEAHLENATLIRAHLEGASLRRAFMQEADLFRAHLEDAYLNEANLAGADLRSTFFDTGSTLRGVTVYDSRHGFISIADTRWAGVNLALLEWPDAKWGRSLVLGDESRAREIRPRDRARLIQGYESAVRANRQFAYVLRSQGLGEEADHFAYRARVLQRIVWWHKRRWLKCALSWFLFVLAGYGYRPLRTLFAYLCVITGFAIGYYQVTHSLHAQPYPLRWYEAIILSISSFHGRGFFQPLQNLGDPVAVLGSLEAVFGLLIEASFIATFTQRFFGR